ncbi:MAG: DUF5666 domain-containing protein [Acidobacteriota bacterium]|nr:DUF5666 domain-containing protein [Acidobacteriota bacterium]
MKRLFILALTFGLITTAANAHNGMIHIMGTVSSITDHDMSVKGANGITQTAVFTATTKFSKTDMAATAKDIKVGDHVVIHATKKGGQLIAAEVKVGAMKMKGMSGDMSGMKMDNPTQASLSERGSLVPELQ